MGRMIDAGLQELLERSGVKQKDLAVALNLHESTVSLKLSGKREMSLQEAKIIAGCIGTSTDQIWHAIDFAKRKVTSNNPGDPPAA